MIIAAFVDWDLRGNLKADWAFKLPLHLFESYQTLLNNKWWLKIALFSNIAEHHTSVENVRMLQTCNLDGEVVCEGGRKTAAAFN